MPAFPKLSFSHLGIFVFDLERMKQFYTQMLGFVASVTTASSTIHRKSPF